MDRSDSHAATGHNSGDEYSQIDVQPISPRVGAEIHGVDLTRPISDQVFSEIENAYREYGVIFFRDQTLTPEQHVSFARKFGEIDVNCFFKAVDGYPMIAEVRKEPEQTTNIGGGWHTDHSYDACPAKGSMLYARELPEVGGDTMFASMYAAYDALSPGLKQTLEGMKALHSSRHVFGRDGRAHMNKDIDGRIVNPDLAIQDAIHPVVIRHPETGRKALYVNRSFTVKFDGWTVDESRPLLNYLYEFASRAEFTCRFRWAPGSLAFWDNRSTWHYAINDYHGDRRLLHRVTIAGSGLD
jgi:taurine dioxygenase